jgi:hypothetical protein
MSNEVAVDLTLHELGVLRQLLELPNAAGIEEDPIADVPEQARSYVVDSVLSALRSRSIVTGEGDDLEVAEPIRLLMSVASQPGVLSLISRQVENIVDTVALAVWPDIAVETRAVGHSLYRLTPFESRDLLARILRLSDLHPTGPVDRGIVLTVASEALDAAAGHLLAGDDIAAAVALGGDPAADTFVEALKTKRAAAQVTILHRPESGRVEGGAVAWIDTGFNGVWTTEAVEADGEPTGDVTIRRVDAMDLVRELFSFLPAAFSEGDPVPADAS